MSEPLRVISCFAGIEGFGAGFEAAGMRVVAQVEIDKQCNRVLAHHYADVLRLGDIREVRAIDCPRADVVCGGVPCQDWSVAGRRAGLAGERSGLFFDFIRFADEVAADWLVFENVPGLLSSRKGRDFAVVLGEITGFYPEVPTRGWRNSGICCGPKRGAAWRVLDAQYLGVAQRRERVFIVGHSRSRTAAAEVLFEPESCAGDSAPSRSAGAGVAATFATSPDGSGAPADISPTLDARAADGPRRNQGGVIVAFDPNQVTSSTNRSNPQPGAPCHTLPAAASAPMVALEPRAFNWQTGGKGFLGYGDKPTALSTNQTPAVLEPAALDGYNYTVSDVAPTMGDNTGECSGRAGVVMAASAVRRLTPRECERLQGFPDDWTAGHADGPRYRMLGNAVCVNVSAWLAKRIAAHTAR